MSTFLITGATGLVGLEMTKFLLEKGRKVVAVYRKSFPTYLKHENLEWVKGDVLNIDFLQQVLPRVSYVIHTAGMVSYDPKDRKEMYHTNIEGTANIVNISLTCSNIKKVCHVSSIAAIGRAEEEVITEDTKWTDNDYNSHYGITKHLAELEVIRATTEGLNAFCVNPSVVLGQGDWERSSTRLFKYVWDENKWCTDGIVNLVDIRYVIASIYLLFEVEGNSGETYILNNVTVSYKDLFKAMADKFGKKAPAKILVSWQIELACLYEKTKAFITKRPPLITKETALTARGKYQYQTNKHEVLSKLKPYTLDQTLNWIIPYLLDKYIK